jgi:putative PIN family toxin of toxin-antitoxin system
MPAKKDRIPVVLDTNVWVRNFKTPHKDNPNRRVVRLWLQEKRLQLIVSDEILEEYFDIFLDLLEMDSKDIARWKLRFKKTQCSVVRLGPRIEESRDPDDNLMLATAKAGKAKFLLTNDKDLLDIPVQVQKQLPFAIMTPKEFLTEIETRS